MAYTYSAFISYRHLPADIEAAKAVQKALETYRIPTDIRKKTGVKKLNRCFHPFIFKHTLNNVFPTSIPCQINNRPIITTTENFSIILQI